MATATTKPRRGGKVPKKKRIDTTHYSRRVALRVMELRVNAGLEVDTFTAKLNRKIGNREHPRPVKLPTVYGWENGNGSIHPDYYPFIARVFGLSVLEILPAK